MANTSIPIVINVAPEVSTRTQIEYESLMAEEKERQRLSATTLSVGKPYIISSYGFAAPQATIAAHREEIEGTDRK